MKAAIDQTRDRFLAALEDMRDTNLRGEAVHRALNAVAEMLLVMQTSSLLYERVHGIDGPPVYPDEEKPRRRMIIEEMASIMSRLVRPAFGLDHIPSGALISDCVRWLGGHPGDTYCQVGYANPSSPDRVELGHRHVAVLLFKLIAAAKGIGERSMIKDIPHAPTYDTFLKWQRKVPTASRKWFQDLGKRAFKQHGADTALLPAIDLTPNENSATSILPYGQETLQLYREEGEPALAKLFAWIGRTRGFRERSRRHGKSGSP
jgi:hypothetical protein